MSKSSKITASELVLSAIFFLQQKNGVTAKDITKFICEKRGCRQSLVRGEVKKALERATENGIFSKKRGLYRIESGFGKNKISIKVNRGTPRNKKVKKMKRSTPVRPTDDDGYKNPVDAPVFAPTLELPSVSRKTSYLHHTCPGGHLFTLNDGLEGKGLKKILMEQTQCAKNAYPEDDDDDEDEDEDFFEEDDDEDDIDYFADDQFPTAADAVKEYPLSEPESDFDKKKEKPLKRKVQSRSKSRTKGKSKKRKLSKPKKKAGKRKRNAVMRKSQKRNREPEASDDESKHEGEKEGEEDENMELDSQAEDNEYGGDDDEYAQNENDMPEGSDYENEENEHNNQDYEYGDDDCPSDEEYLKQQEEASKTKGIKGAEKKDGTSKIEEEGGQNDKKQPITTTNAKVNQNSTAEGKVTSNTSATKPTSPKPQETANQDQKSKPIRSSSLFSSFKKKNEAKNSAIDRKQVKSRM